MVKFYLTCQPSDPDSEFSFISIPESLAKVLMSWIHEEVPHDFIDLGMDLDLDVNVDIDLDKYKKALLRTFVKDYNMEYLREHDL